jgi:hypothetical protein
MAMKRKTKSPTQKKRTVEQKTKSPTQKKRTVERKTKSPTQNKRTVEQKMKRLRPKKSSSWYASIIGTLIFALLAGTSPWWWSFGDDVVEQDADRLLARYVKCAQEQQHDKAKHLYMDFENCASCQQDQDNLRKFSGEDIKIILKTFSAKDRTLQTILEFDGGRHYEPTFHLANKQLFPIRGIHRTIIKEVKP